MVAMSTQRLMNSMRATMSYLPKQARQGKFNSREFNSTQLDLKLPLWPYARMPACMHTYM